MSFDVFENIFTASDLSGGRVIKVSALPGIDSAESIYTQNDPAGGRAIKVKIIAGGASTGTLQVAGGVALDSTVRNITDSASPTANASPLFLSNGSVEIRHNLNNIDSYYLTIDSKPPGWTGVDRDAFLRINTYTGGTGILQFSHGTSRTNFASVIANNTWGMALAVGNSQGIRFYTSTSNLSAEFGSDNIFKVYNSMALYDRSSLGDSKISFRYGALDTLHGLISAESNRFEISSRNSLPIWLSTTSVTSALIIDNSGRLQFGGATSSFPSLKRNSAALEVRLADDSAYGPFNTGTISVLNAGLTLNPAVNVSGSWFVGATPQMVIQPAATASPSWSSNGTGLGINAPTGLAASAHLISLWANGTAVLRAQYDSTLILGGNNARLFPALSTGTGSSPSISGTAISVFPASLASGHGLLVATPAIASTASGDNGGLKITTSFAPAAGAASFNPINIAYTVNASGAQTGTVTGIFARGTETNLNGATHNLIDLGTASTSIFSVSNVGVPNFNQTTAGTAGAAANVWLNIRVGATNYKIALLNP